MAPPAQRWTATTTATASPPGGWASTTQDESWAARTVPFPLTGATVEVTGTFSWKSWDGLSRPILQDLQALEGVEGPEQLADLGGSCALDLDCRDELVCDRESLACNAPPEEISL